MITPPRVENDIIRVTEDFAHTLILSDEQVDVLNRALVGKAVCPAMAWFKDTPEVRELLGMEAKN